MLFLFFLLLLVLIHIFESKKQYLDIISKAHYRILRKKKCNFDLQTNKQRIFTEPFNTLLLFVYFTTKFKLSYS